MNEKHGKIPQDQTHEKEIGTLPDKEVRATIVKTNQSLNRDVKTWSSWRSGSWEEKGKL